MRYVYIYMSHYVIIDLWVRNYTALCSIHIFVWCSCFFSLPDLWASTTKEDRISRWPVWLVVWNMFFIPKRDFFIIPSDEQIFFTQMIAIILLSMCLDDRWWHPRSWIMIAARRSCGTRGAPEPCVATQAKAKAKVVVVIVSFFTPEEDGVVMIWPRNIIRELIHHKNEKHPKIQGLYVVFQVSSFEVEPLSGGT